MRGRKPIPTALRLVKGNAGHRKAIPPPATSPKPPGRPAHLSVEAAKEWDDLAPQLHEAGLLSTIDKAALAAYCQAYGRWVEAELALQEHGVLVKSPNGFPMVSPYLTVANKALDQMSRLLVEFGMSPSSRSRVTASQRPTVSKLAKYLA